MLSRLVRQCANRPAVAAALRASSGVPESEPSFYEMVEIFFDRAADYVETKMIQDIKDQHKPAMRSLFLGWYTRVEIFLLL